MSMTDYQDPMALHGLNHKHLKALAKASRARRPSKRVFVTANGTVAGCVLTDANRFASN